jgi:hypothetical protein
MSVFSPRSNAIARASLAAILTVPVALVVFPLVYARTPFFTNQAWPIQQPVEFDHRHHVADDGIDCRYCHDTVETAASAGFPTAERCMSCHAQIWNKSPLLEPVRRAYFENRPLVWKRVHQLPGFVYFNHSIHVAKGIGCVTCHGRVDQMAAVEQVSGLNMRWCLRCHREPEQHLRPQEEITSMTWQPPAGAANPAQELADRYQLHTRTSCSTCHR